MLSLTRTLVRSALALSLAAPAALAAEKVFVGENFFLWDLYGYPVTWENAYYNCFDAVSVAQVGDRMFSLDGDGRFSHAHVKTHYVQVLMQLPFEGGIDVAGHQGDVLVAAADGTIARLDGATLLPEATLHVGVPITSMTTAGDVLAVGSADGLLRLGNATTGDFKAICDVDSPITSLHAHAGLLYFGTSSGAVWSCDPTSGGIAFVCQAGNDAQTLASYQGKLLVGGTDKTIERHDPVSGVLIDTLVRDEPVLALVTYEDPTEIELTQTAVSTSLASGVNVQLAIDAGTARAGQFYIVLGSQQPSWQPSNQLFVNGIGVPLTVDDYFLLTLSGGASSFLQNARGFLPASGTATAKFILPPHSVSAQWVYAAHSAVTFDFANGVVSGSSTWRQFWAM